VERLCGIGARVRVLDNFSTGKRENLRPLLSGIELIEGDIADPQVCTRACGTYSSFCTKPHSLRFPSQWPTRRQPPFERPGNVQHAGRGAGGGSSPFIYAASSSAYGETETLPKVESIPPQPLSPYAVQKLTGEYYCSVFARCYGLQTLSIRYFNVFGPRQDPQSQYAAAIPAFITSIMRDVPPTVYGTAGKRGISPISRTWSRPTCSP